MSQYLSRLITYRAAMPAAPHIPLGVRSVGRYEVSQNWSEETPRKDFIQIFWTVSGHGHIHHKDQWHGQEPGNVFCYAPGSNHVLGAESGAWCYCWMTLDHPRALDWLRDLDIHPGTRSAGPCPESQFLEIAEALRGCTLEGECRAAQLAHAILIKASVQALPPQPESLPALYKSILDARFTDPSLSLVSIAEELAVHRSTLTRHFATTYGMKPSSYLHNLRMQRGLSLLRENNNPIQEVSQAAGFQDPNYFARAVREATGLSPRGFRRS